jgi:hypothetical protein
MRRLAWLGGVCLAIAACSVNPIGLTDGGVPPSGHAGGSGTGNAGTSGAAGAGAAGTSGAAGNTGAAGAPGAAGDSGAAGTSGVAGTNGAAGTGSAGGTSGAAGTTGAAGTGAAGKPGTGAAGTTGAAGNPGPGTAGTTGAAGSPADGGAVQPDAGNVCLGFEQQYAAALTAAKMCNIALDRLTCQISVDSSLSCPICKVWVDNKTQLDQIRKAWQDARCDQIKYFCPAIACVNPGKSMCNPPKSGVIGMCGGLTVQPL